MFLLSCLNKIAVEIENPFGADLNDLDAALMQEELNNSLLALASSAALNTPTLLAGAPSLRVLTSSKTPRESLLDAWQSISSDGEVARRSSSFYFGSEGVASVGSLSSRRSTHRLASQKFSMSEASRAIFQSSCIDQAQVPHAGTLAETRESSDRHVTQSTLVSDHSCISADDQAPDDRGPWKSIDSITTSNQTNTMSCSQEEVSPAKSEISSPAKLASATDLTLTIEGETPSSKCSFRKIDTPPHAKASPGEDDVILTPASTPR